MASVNILGAGELGATLARLLAERETFRRVAMIDPDVGKAKGKALDIAQSGPVDGYDVSIDGFGSLDAAPPADFWVVADPPELAGPGAEKRVGDLSRDVAGCAGESPILVAPAVNAAALVEALAQRAGQPARVVGSAAVAYASALRRRLATELGIEPSAIRAELIGLPPAHALMPLGTASAGGVPIEHLSVSAVRRVLEGLRSRIPGPVALAHGAASVAAALLGERPAVLPVLVLLTGQYGHRGIALAVPARVCRGGADVVEVPLAAVERVAFDTAAERRRQGRD